MESTTIKFQRDPSEYKEVWCVVCGMDDLVMVEHWNHCVRYRCEDCYIPVEIHELAPVNSGRETAVKTVRHPYELSTDWECRIFELVQEHRQTIAQGSTIACPAK